MLPFSHSPILPFFQSSIISFAALRCSPARCSFQAIRRYGEAQSQTPYHNLLKRLRRFRNEVSGNWYSSFSCHHTFYEPGLPYYLLYRLRAERISRISNQTRDLRSSIDFSFSFSYRMECRKIHLFHEGTIPGNRRSRM